MNVRYTPFLAVSVVLGFLSGCEQPQTNTDSAAAAQVGNEVISESELSFAMARLGSAGSNNEAQLRGKVLDGLIDQHLISKAARQAGLDKDPQVVLALAHAERQILGERYVATLFKDAEKPPESDVNDYYVKHPELFSGRRIYHIQEITLKLNTSRMPEIEFQLKKSKNLAEFSEWLKSQGVENQASMSVKTAEQIPATTLAHLKDMEDGQVAVLASGSDQLSVLLLQASQVQPVTLDQARGAIEQVLLSRVRKDLLDAEVKKLRSREKLVYGQGFSPAKTGQGMTQSAQ